MARPAPGGGVDYEQAWARLQVYVGSKTQHGQVGLLLEMAKIAEDCQVPGDRRESGDEPADSAADGVGGGTDGSPTVIGRGGHDGSSNGHGRRAAAGAGV